MCNPDAKERNWWDRILWQARWSEYCTHCEGEGGSVSYYDPSPAGVSLSPGYMVDWDPCPHCTEKGICPRCGADLPLVTYEDFDGTLVVDDETDPNKPCLRCGWNPDKPDICPPLMECECWYEEEKKYWQEYDRLLDQADWREDWRVDVE